MPRGRLPTGMRGDDLEIAAADDREVAGFFIGDKNLIAVGGAAAR